MTPDAIRSLALDILAAGAWQPETLVAQLVEEANCTEAEAQRAVWWLVDSGLVEIGDDGFVRREG